MRVSLTSDPAEFVKQIAALRRQMHQLEQSKSAGDRMKARLMLAVLVPYLGALRAELRQDDYAVPDLMEAVSELAGNLIASVLQSIFDEMPDEVRADMLKRMAGHAFDTAAQTFENDARLTRDQAEQARPKLAVVPKDMEAGANVVPISRKTTKGD